LKDTRINSYNLARTLVLATHFTNGIHGLA